MTAGLYNFTIEQGTTIRIRFVWTDSNDAIVDLTGASCRMQWRKSKSMTSQLIADVSDYLTLTAASGQVDLVIPGDVSEAYTFSSAHYSLRVDRPGDDHRLIEGVIRNSQETTA